MERKFGNLKSIFFVTCLIFSMTKTPILLGKNQDGTLSEKQMKRKMNFSLPLINLSGDLSIRGELALAFLGGLALEMSFKKHQEEALLRDQNAGISQIASAQGISLHFARYGEPLSLSGFYYGGGTGYRREQIDWLSPADPSITALNVAENTAWKSRLAELSGPTFHARLGYRYVGKELPFLIGSYAGLRHFAAEVTEIKGTSLVRSSSHAKTTQKVPSLDSSPLSSQDELKLKNSYRTRIEGGIEFGITF